jgi:hypothetical protein
MSGIMCSLVGAGGGFPALTLSVGFHQTYRPQSGTTTNFYGYLSGQYGALTPSVNNFPPNTLYTISELEYIDNTNAYYLSLTGAAPNSGWTSISFHGLTLLRTSASYSSGNWTWVAPDSGSALTTAVATNIKVVFL